MSVSGYETGYGLVRDVSRGGLLTAVGSGTEGGGVGALRSAGRAPRCMRYSVTMRSIGAAGAGPVVAPVIGGASAAGLPGARAGAVLFVSARRRAPGTHRTGYGVWCRADRDGAVGRFGCSVAREAAGPCSHRRAGESRDRSELLADPAATYPICAPAIRRRPTGATGGAKPQTLGCALPRPGRVVHHWTSVRR